MYRDERFEGAETYLLPSTLLAITVYVYKLFE